MLFFTNRMKKIILKMGILAVLTIIILPTVSVFAAEGDYTVLAPLPGISGTLSGENILGTYVPAIFKIAIGLSAVFAVLMIVIGGFQYISSDAVMKKSEGKERIKNAVLGLVLVISAWLILNEINPNLLNINLNIEPITTKSIAGTLSKEGVKMTATQITDSNSVRTSLETEGVLTYAGPCTAGQTSGCVNLNGLSETIKDSLITLNKICDENMKGSGGCSIMITGGTEAGAHSVGSVHYTGNAVDLRTNANLTGYVVENGGTPVETKYGYRYELKIDGQTVYFLDEGDHWHVSTGSSGN